MVETWMDRAKARERIPLVGKVSAWASSLILVLLAGCGSAHERPTTAPVRLLPTPQWVRQACGGFRESIRSFCPGMVPAGPRGLTLSVALAAPRYPINLLQLEAGGEYFGNERLNRPPRYVGLFLASGKLDRMLAVLFPPAGARPTVARDGLATRALKKGLALGRRRWAGFDGELSLAPSQGRIPLVYFNYLLFRWHDGDGDHVLGLHKWEPFHETVRTLHAVVDRLRPAAAKPLAAPASASAPGRIVTTGTPEWLLAACRSLRTRPICPRRIPAADAHLIDVYYEPSWRSGSSPSARQDLIGVSWGAPYENRPTKDSPPRFLHLELAAGAVPVDRRFDHPVVGVHDGLMRGRGYEGAPPPLPLGRRDWNGRRGVLVLGDCFGNHLCFRWRERGVPYQIDLHGWEPFTQTVAALREIVSAIPAAG
jgi:hypothetical protein